MTELEKIAAQMELFSGKTTFTTQEFTDFTILCLNAARVRIELLEERVSKLEKDKKDSSHRDLLDEAFRSDIAT